MPVVDVTNPNKVKMQVDSVLPGDMLTDAILNGLVSDKTINNIRQLTCILCKKTCTGEIPMMQHLRSAAHIKQIQLEDLKSCLSSPKVHKEMPIVDVTNPKEVKIEDDSALLRDVVDAIKSGQVLCHNPNNQMQLICALCNITCTGTVPMEQHFASEVHAKKKRLEDLKSCFSSPKVHKEMPVVDVTNPKDVKMKADSVLSEDVLTDAILNELVSDETVNNIRQLTCILCKKTCTGEIPMMQHLSSAAHTKQIHVTSMRTSPGRNASDTPVMASINTNIASPACTSAMQENTVAEALAQGTVIHAEHCKSHLQCLLCNKIVNGTDTMRDHLNGKLHLKKQKIKSLEPVEQPVIKSKIKESICSLPPPAAAAIETYEPIIPPPQQFLDSADLQRTTNKKLKQEDGKNLENLKSTAVTEPFHWTQIPYGELIKDIRIYSSGESLAGLFDE